MLETYVARTHLS